MALKKKIYIHFEKSDYVSNKSEFLKVQIDLLNLKKIVKNLDLTRQKKKYYHEMLQGTLSELKKRISKLDDLMPEDSEISEFNHKKNKSKINQKRKIVKKVSGNKAPEIKDSSKVDDIEQELLKIKEKLSSLSK